MHADSELTEADALSPGADAGELVDEPGTPLLGLRPTEKGAPVEPEADQEVGSDWAADRVQEGGPLGGNYAPVWA